MLIYLTRSYIYFSEHPKVNGPKTDAKENGRQKNCVPSNHILKVISKILYLQTEQLSNNYLEERSWKIVKAKVNNLIVNCHNDNIEQTKMFPTNMYKNCCYKIGETLQSLPYSYRVGRNIVFNLVPETCIAI